MPQVSLTVNGKAHTVEVEGRTLLVELLREKLRLTGTHVGCDTTQCGACTVLFNGDAVKSCTVLAMQADGAEVVTIEGVGGEARLHPVQEAFRDKHGLQCGFCTPGMIMATEFFLRKRPELDDASIHCALEGNICRCTGYVNIIEAVKHAAHVMYPDTAPSEAGEKGTA